MTYQSLIKPLGMTYRLYVMFFKKQKKVLFNNLEFSFFPGNNLLCHKNALI